MRVLKQINIMIEMKRTAILACLMAATTVAANAQHTYDVSVSNQLKREVNNVPVVWQLPIQGVRSALVTLDGKEIPCQLDDLDGNGTLDELCFMTNMNRREKQVFKVTLSEQGEPVKYEPRVYVEMLLTNKKVKEENKQDLYISELKVDRGVNPYWMIHHHGAAFENELVAYRIYFDHRQTVDIYGKYHQQLELRDTQFYPDAEQKAKGYGDDVLWVGQTLGLGTLRGWDGQKPTMVQDVEHRSQRIVSRGPLRTIVEVKDEAWVPQPGQAPIDMTTRYTLYAGRRDCAVDITFGRNANDYRFSTGMINVKNSTEFSDQRGLRGCWGTDWPVSAKDSVGHKRETVGLGILLNSSNVVEERPADKDNYPFVVAADGQRLHYDIVFCSDNETFGMHSEREWFEFLKRWKEELESRPVVR